ncbi:MAG: twin-arginine translocase TatA/TatE family subunit [Candidatus Hydrothermarchaeales archaeon]
MTTGGTELLVVLALAVLLFGPKKLPELAKTLGQAMGEYHKAQREFETEMRKTTSAIDKEVSSVTNAETRAATPKPAQPKQTAPQTKTKAQKITPPTTTPKSQEVKEIAKNLGIETANKTDAQLLREISLKTKKKEASEV